MNACCRDAVKHAQRWELDEGEVECQWCGKYVPVETVQSELLGSWAPPDPLQQQGASYLPGLGKHAPRTLLNGRYGHPSIPPLLPRPPWTPKGETLNINPTRPYRSLGEAWGEESDPVPPRHPSPAREAFRTFLINEVFGGPDVKIDGSASLLADMISYALEKREQERVWAGNRLLVEINNLLDLLTDESPERWQTIQFEEIHGTGPYLGVGWYTDEDDAEVMSVALTGKVDESGENLAQFFGAMPDLLGDLKEFLSDPL